jgi:hypothetical protein
MYRQPSASTPSDSFYAPSVAILVDQDGHVGVPEALEIVGQAVGLLPAELEQERTSVSQEARGLTEDAA